MTNQEWLLTLKPNECALFCLSYIPKIGRSYSSSRYGVDIWLQQKYVGELDYVVAEFNKIIKYEEALTHQHEDKGE